MLRPVLLQAAVPLPDIPLRSVAQDGVFPADTADLHPLAHSVLLRAIEGTAGSLLREPASEPAAAQRGCRMVKVLRLPSFK